METNAKIEKLLLAVNNAFDNLVSRKSGFRCHRCEESFSRKHGNTDDPHGNDRCIVCDDIKARIGIDRAKGTYPAITICV